MVRRNIKDGNPNSKSAGRIMNIYQYLKTPETNWNREKDLVKEWYKNEEKNNNQEIECNADSEKLKSTPLAEKSESAIGEGRRS